MLSLRAPFFVMLAVMDDWGNYIYLAFFIVAGLASALGKLLKRGQQKKNTAAADSDVELEAEILPEPAPARKVERPQPSVMASPPEPPAARPAAQPATFLPGPPAARPPMKSVPAPPPIEPAQPTHRKPRRLTQEAQAKAAYQQQVEADWPPAPLAARQPVAPQRSNVPPDVRVIRRLLADRTGQRAAIALCEVLGPPIALRDSHLER